MSDYLINVNFYYGLERIFLRYFFLPECSILALIRLIRLQFGGDPDHVVIHGLSAGAGSVALHLTAYGGRDDHLFVAAISESTFFPAQPEVPELEYQFNRTVQIAGCQDASDIMACLRQQSQDTLQVANTAAPFPGQSGYPLFYWTPCVDGDLIRTAPYTQFESNSFIKVPIIFGTCTNGESRP